MKKGFTLIEILIVIGIIAVLAAGIILSLNPGRQFAKTRDTQRIAHLNDILNGILQNMIDNQGKFSCVNGDLPTSSLTNMSSNTGDYNIAPCLVPSYMSKLPVDPSKGTWTSTSSYNSGYRIQFDETLKRINLEADGELTPVISISK